LYLYKSVEALVASNRANPVHDGLPDSAVTASVAIDIDKPAATANGTATSTHVSVTPERRATANGVLVKSSRNRFLQNSVPAEKIFGQIFILKIWRNLHPKLQINNYLTVMSTSILGVNGAKKQLHTFFMFYP
jgi:hypothetical protein